jgi:hypothetical protein
MRCGYRVPRMPSLHCLLYYIIHCVHIMWVQDFTTSGCCATSQRCGKHKPYVFVCCRIIVTYSKQQMFNFKRNKETVQVKHVQCCLKHKAQKLRKNQGSSSGVNFSKRVDIERSGPPKKYRDDIDSESFHNPLCSYVEISERWRKNYGTNF